MVTLRRAFGPDVAEILSIYNQGIEDRVATLEMGVKDTNYRSKWFSNRQERYGVLVAESDNKVVGWASSNPYSHRCAYAGVGELSIYIHRDWRGKGVGQLLLAELEQFARNNDFHKIVLGTFPFNKSGQGLYCKMGYREVGVFQNHGVLDGKWVDVMWMEKLL